MAALYSLNVTTGQLFTSSRTDWPVGSLLHCPLHSPVTAAQHILSWCEGMQVPLFVSPYERMDTLSEIMPTGLCCKGGEQHLTIAPNGDAWPCLTTLRSPFWKETCLGNWVDGTLDMSRKAQPCHLNCVDYYILPEQHQAGDMWGIEATPCES